MKFENIKESGTNNILLWAITNGANIKTDKALQSVINDELNYLVTISDINFFELFRLTQIYRDKIRIIEEKQAEMPTRSELHSKFKGTYKTDDNKEEVQLCEIAEYCGDKFINLAMQMTNDDHIIHSSAVRLFLPMISRKFTIQIPVDFVDIIDSMSEDEANQIFNQEYPGTLQTIPENDTHGVIIKLKLAIMRGTQIIKYDKQYEKYIKLLKYSPLKSINTNNLYKITMLGFFKYDNISRSNVRIDLFNVNRESMGSTLKRMAHIDNPVEVEFAIQLPIQYMQMLENSFNQDELTIAYESSMSDIIDGSLTYKDFITSEYNEDSEEFEKFNNAIDSYHIRIAETNQTLLQSMQILLNTKGDTDVDISSVFALMPSIYTTKAVIRINSENISKMMKHYDQIIVEMFKDANNIISAVLNDIQKSK